MIKSQIKIEGKNDRILTLEKDSIKGLDKFEFNVEVAGSAAVNYCRLSLKFSGVI